VYRLADAMIYAATGAVGMGQLIADELARAYANKAFTNCASPEQLMNRIAQTIEQVVRPYLQSGTSLQKLGQPVAGSLCKSLVAISFKNTPCLFQFDFNGAPERATEHLPFVSLGSGQPIADPFLAFLKRLIWAGSQPTLAEGKLASVWTIDHVCKTNPGGVGGEVQLMALPTAGKISELDTTEVAEHRQLAAAAETALVKALRPEPAAVLVEPPPMPLPPAG
jgi:hypothetical protein